MFKTSKLDADAAADDGGATAAAPDDAVGDVDGAATCAVNTLTIFTNSSITLPKGISSVFVVTFGDDDARDNAAAPDDARDNAAAVGDVIVVPVVPVAPDEPDDDGACCNTDAALRELPDILLVVLFFFHLML